MTMDLTALDQDAQRLAVFEWRKAGWSIAMIAAETGLTRQAISALIKKELESLRSQLASSIEDNRLLDLERIDVAIKSLWPTILSGSTRSIEVFIRLLERRAKLLGLDAPERTISVDLTSHLENLSPAELLAEAQRLGLPCPQAPSHLLPLPGTADSPKILLESSLPSPGIFPTNEQQQQTPPQE